HEWWGLPADMPADLKLPFQSGSEHRVMPHAWGDRFAALWLDHGRFDGPLLPLFAGLLPLVALTRLPAWAAACRRAVFAYLGLWLLFGPDVRFLAPVLPLLAGLCAARLEPLLAGARTRRRALGVLAQANLAGGAVYAASYLWITCAPFAMPLGLESARDKLELGLRPAPYLAQTAAFINARVPPAERVMLLCHFNSYYIERECLGDFHFGSAQGVKVIRAGRTADGIRKRLRQLGVRWLLSLGPMAEQYADIPGFFDVPPGGWAAWKRFLATGTRAEWQTVLLTLYRVGPPHVPRSLPSLPMLEALAFRQADKDLAAGRARQALAAYRAPPPLLADVGSTAVREAEARVALRDFAGAERCYRRAAREGVDAPDLHLGLAHCLLERDERVEALAHVRRALAENPRSAFGRELLAAIEVASRRVSPPGAGPGRTSAGGRDRPNRTR
ncbi:MAG: hypothetical protein AAB368_01890, partial [bacterium]